MRSQECSLIITMIFILISHVTVGLMWFYDVCGVPSLFYISFVMCIWAVSVFSVGDNNAKQKT